MNSEFDLTWSDIEKRGLTLRCHHIRSEHDAPRGTIICVPGFSASGRSFARLGPLAREFDLHLTAPPLDVSYPGDPIETQAEVIAEYVREFEKPVLLGTSFGGLVSIRAAALASESLGGVVLIGAFARGTALVPSFMKHVLPAMQIVAAPLAPVTARVVGGRRIDAAGARVVVEDTRAISAEERARRLRAIFRTDLTGALHEIRAPSLVIHGTADRLVPVHLAREMAQHLPDTTYHEITGCGHLPYVTHPWAVIDILRPFLDTVHPRMEAGFVANAELKEITT